MDDFDFFDFVGSNDTPVESSGDWWSDFDFSGGAGDSFSTQGAADDSMWDFGGDVAPADTSNWWDDFDFSGGAGDSFSTAGPADDSMWDFGTDVAPERDFWGPSADNPNLEKGFDLDAARAAEMAKYQAFMDGGQQTPSNDFYGNQDFGQGAITQKNIDGMNAGYQKAWDNGGYTSGWQTTPSGERVMVQDDGSAIAINPSTGASRGILADEVTNMVKGGALNTYGSGYNTATGGGIFGAGGTPSVIGNLLGGAGKILGNAVGGTNSTGTSGAGNSSGGESSAAKPAATTGVVAPNYSFLEGIGSMLPVQTIAQLMSQR